MAALLLLRPILKNFGRKSCFLLKAVAWLLGLCYTVEKEFYSGRQSPLAQQGKKENEFMNGEVSILKDQWNQSGGWNSGPSNNGYGYQSGNQGNRKLIRALSYVPVLFWLPLVCYKNDSFERNFANQGLWLLILNVIVAVVRWVVMFVFGGIFLLGSLLSLVFSLIGLVLFVLMVFGIVRAATGGYFEIPVLGRITLL